MKLHLLPLLIFLLCTVGIFSQNASVKKEDETIYSNPEIPAEYPGGISELNRYIVHNFNLNQCLNNSEISSKIVAKFVVKKDGSIDDIKIEKCPCENQECKEQVIRLLKATSKWKPAQIKGKVVNSYYNLAVIIELIISADIPMQDDSESNDDLNSPPEIETHTNVIEFPDISPEFQGGTAEMLKFLKENLKYPQFAIENEIQGKCYLKFVVNKDGSLSNIVVVRGVPDCQECDKEAIRLIKLMPNWKPGTVDGKVVNTYYTIPIIFRLE